MEPNFSIPQSKTDLLDNLINNYNKSLVKTNGKESLKEIKDREVSLTKINSIVFDLLGPSKDEKDMEESKKIARGLKSILKKIKVQTHDIALWNQMMKLVEKEISSDLTPITFDEIPVELYPLMMPSLDRKEFDALSKTNTKFRNFIKDPQSIAYFLDKFSSELPLQNRLLLAQKCGSSLKKADFSGTELTDKDLETLVKSCPEIVSLNLSDTSITKLTLPQDIKVLNLDNCNHIYEKELEKIVSYPKLEELCLRNTRLNTLAYLPRSLKKADFSQTTLTDKDLETLVERCPELVSLNLSDIPKITKLIVPKGIKVLNLDGCDIDAEELKKINSCTKLEELNLIGSEINTLDYLPKGLKKLNLKKCYMIDSEKFERLSSLTEIEDLNVSFTNIQSLINISRNLKVLNIRKCIKIKSEEFEDLISFSKLEILDASVNKMKKFNLPDTLKVLDLSGCEKIKDDQIDKLYALKKLQKLKISETYRRTILPDMLSESLQELNGEEF